MKEFYTLIDKNGKTVKLYLKNKIFCVEKVSINECEFFKGLNAAKNAAHLINNELKEKEISFINCEKPFKENKVIISRSLV